MQGWPCGENEDDSKIKKDKLGKPERLAQFMSVRKWLRSSTNSLPTFCYSVNISNNAN